tara:strand:+ start:3750 stop:4121 length:372 start_codon:yes stop_codon:yes gene_type:complete
MNKPNLKKPRSAWWGEYDNQTVVYLPLTAGETAIMDAEDWPRVRQQYGAEWFCNRNGKSSRYARRRYVDDDGKANNVTLQRAVIDAKQGQRVKALNGNPLDCRRANLHIMSEAEKRHLWRVHA